MENKTAVEWLVEQVFTIDRKLNVEEIILEAKEMEKQQKDVDYQNGYLDCYAKLMSERLTRDI